VYVIEKVARNLLARWRRRRAQRHISGWDIPTFDHDSGDITKIRDVVAELIEADRLRKARKLP